MACEKDRQYLPARINLISALILRQLAGGRDAYYQAMAIADDADRIVADHPAIILNRAILDYEKDRKRRSEAIHQVRELLKRKPAFAEAYYALGTMLSGSPEQRKVWMRCLAMNELGGHARYIAQSMNCAMNKKSANTFDGLRSPFPIGPLTRTSIKELKKLEANPIEVGLISGNMFQNERVRILEIDYSVAFVEEKLIRPIKTSEIESRFGNPIRKYPLDLQTQTWIYDRISFDLSGDTTRIVVHF